MSTTGTNSAKDFESGYIGNANHEVDAACQLIKSDPNLANGYHAVGFSQGGQFLRAVAERCPEPRMKNLITLGAQHQGVFGLPRCPGENATLCNLARHLLNYGAYRDFVQNSLIQAQYWHDPIQEELYQNKSIFLADINNQKSNSSVNQLYKENLAQLTNFIMVMFANDTMVDPKESSLFGWYKPGSQGKETVDFRNTSLYEQDLIGLKKLDQEGKIFMYTVPGDHLQLDIKWFTEEIVKRWLKM